MMAKHETLFDLYTEGLKLIGASRVNEAEKAFFEVIARYLEAGGKAADQDRAAVTESFFQAGTIAKTMGDIAPAAVLLGEALARGCEHPEAATGLAFALLHCNRLDAAEKALEALPGGARRFAEAEWLRGQIALKRKDFPAAETWLRKAIATGPARGEMLVDLSFALEGQKNYRGGVEAVAEALKINPGLYDVYLEAGDRAFALDQEGPALWWLRRTEKVAPASPAAWYYLGARYYALGARDEAERAYLASLTLGPSLNSYNSLSRLLEQSNRLKQAASVARAGLRIDPSNGGLLSTLARCRSR
ncbi:MAG TPA: tetratricopeptide repeat protein, partial [Sphingomonadales bacterium]|nr:tetratricopeptide repeat protein [Sphingomonadales bacterium]